MVGSAIVRNLREAGYQNILTKNRLDLDLLRQDLVEDYLNYEQPDYIFVAAARVGGIQANNLYRGEFLYENLTIQTNIIHAAFKAGVRRLLFLGSSCIYPRNCPQPIKEDYLLSGRLESTNEPYAIAKIAGIKLCESYNRQYGCDFRSVMPTNLYGTNDNFHPENSHVIPALMRRFHEAKVENHEKVTVWGSGTPRREFLHVDDMARACVAVMALEKEQLEEVVQPMLSHINVGTGEDCSIRTLSEVIAKVVGFKGDIEFDASKPDGTPRKLLDVSRLHALGWKHQYSLEAGLAQTYQWFLAHEQELRCS